MNITDYIKKILRDWELSTLDFFPKLFLSIIILFLFFFLAKIGRKISIRIYSRTLKSNADIGKIIASIIYFFLLLSGVFITLEILGLEKVLTKLLAGAGVVGIVAGFAFKDIASNVFAGLLLSLQRPIKIGDWVQIDNNYGTVLEISWLTTTIETIPGQEVFVPNQIIYSSTFTNFTTFNKRRIIIHSSVSNVCDLIHVKAVALEEIKKSDMVLENEDVDFYYTNIGNSMFDFEVSFWISFNEEKDYQQARSDTIMRLKQRFENEKILLL